MVVVLAGVLAAGCSPTSTTGASAADRAARAREATRELEAAQRKDLGCKNVVMSEEDRQREVYERTGDLKQVVDYIVAETAWGVV